MTDGAGGAPSIFCLEQSGGADLVRFSIESSDSRTWSHITTRKSKADGAILTLHANNSSESAAIARERKVSARPGVVESLGAIAGVFEVVDHEGGKFATLRKKPLRSVLRTTWEIELADGARMVGREAKPLQIALRRLLMLIKILIDIPVRRSSGFVFRGNGGQRFTIETGPKRGIKVTTADVDERIALLQAALTRTR